MPAFQDLTGLRFGRLTIVSRAENGNDSKPRWLCQCDCGNTSVVSSSNLKRNNARSCGCLKSELTSERTRTHGLNGTRTHRSWTTMKSRCSNPKDSSFGNYRERGITVCDRWLKFENFYEDMGDRPEDMSLDRIDNNSGYSKENCRWATQQEQGNNRRTNRFLDFEGKRQTVTQWASEIGVHRHTIYARLERGWTIEKALTTIL